MKLSGDSDGVGARDADHLSARDLAPSPNRARYNDTREGKLLQRDRRAFSLIETQPTGAGSEYGRIRGNCSHAALVVLEFLGFRRHLRERFLLNRSGPAPVFEQRQKRNPALDPCRNLLCVASRRVPHRGRPEPHVVVLRQSRALVLGQLVSRDHAGAEDCALHDQGRHRA